VRCETEVEIHILYVYKKYLEKHNLNFSIIFGGSLKNSVNSLKTVWPLLITAKHLIFVLIDLSLHMLVFIRLFIYPLLLAICDRFLVVP